MKNLFKIGLWLTLLFIASFQCLKCFAQDDSIKRFAWNGRIGKNIPISVWFEVRSDGLIAGELLYTRTGSGKPILLLGQYNKEYNQFIMEEYQPDGFQSGMIGGIVNENGIFEGNWSVIKNTKNGTVSKDYAMILDNVIDFPKEKKSLLQPAKLEDIGGEYSYYHTHGGGGERGGSINVKRNEESVRFDISVYDPNLADASNENDDNPVKLVENKFSYVIKECNYSFECEFFNDFVYIRDLGEPTSDCFGANTSLIGVYIKNKK
jgi:hypothetical protein